MAEASSNRRLDSWKDIAAYLRRDERTAQRWARERGLPVHHVPGPGRGRVFAYTEEIDGWLKQPNGFSAQTADRAVAQTAGAAGVPGWQWLARRKVLAWILLAGFAVVAAVLALPSFRSRAVPAVDHLTFAGRVVEARDARGRVLWEYEFPAEHRARLPSDTVHKTPTNWVADLDGDGRREVLALAGHAGQEAQGAVLYCWSGDGRLLWRYEPKESLRFAGRAFESPWDIYSLLLLPQGKTTAVWLAVVNPPWWPAYVVRLDAQGRAEMRFVNSGTIWDLNSVSPSSGTYLLAGGYNNEHDGGFLALLSTDEPAGASPQGAESPFRCETCPPGNPIRYYVFPRTELNRSQNAYAPNFVNEILTTPRRVVISAREVNSHRAIYEFLIDSELKPAVASLSDGFPQEHQRLEKLGRVDHPFEKCPDATQPLKARMWTPDAGWTEIVFPTNATRVPAAGPAQ